MDILDFLLMLIVVAFAVSGYRQGFVVGVLSFAGFVGGFALGIVIVPMFLNQVSTGLLPSVIALCAVLAFAVVGQVLGSILGGRLRESVTWQPAQLVDAVSGAIVGVIAVLLVAWFLASALYASAVPTVSDQVRGSRILKGLTNVLPANANTWIASFTKTLDRTGFPQVFAPFQDENVPSADPPDQNLAAAPTAAVQQAERSIVKVLGAAPSCGKDIEGSGFVFAPGKVMTNAHVVGGTRSLTVQAPGGRQLEATVVLFDPQRDVAVLDVPQLTAAPLPFDYTGQTGASAIVAGYPENGGYTLDAARIREPITATGQDIYSRNTVTRKVFSLYALVRQGNSGGPLLTPDGKVYGVVFAKSLNDANTGYALTASEVQSDAQAGLQTDTPVNTESCAI
jgi:S1-C subfamily serine protease